VPRFGKKAVAHLRVGYAARAKSMAKSSSSSNDGKALFSVTVVLSVKFSLLLWNRFRSSIRSTALALPILRLIYLSHVEAWSAPSEVYKLRDPIFGRPFI